MITLLIALGALTVAVISCALLDTRPPPLPLRFSRQ
jgi:hypothetical protein